MACSAEPAWLNAGFRSPYYNDSHVRVWPAKNSFEMALTVLCCQRALQKAARQFFDEHVQDEAQLHETTGKRPSPELIQLMGKEGIEINAMRLGEWRLYDLSSPLRTSC